nr:2-dehydropantoate 2-reductase [uncultured Roseateles sp.]
MKICIVGAGAIGGWFGAFLGAKLGAEVELSVLARGATLAALRQHGLRMDTGGERISVTPARLSDEPAELGVQDLIILAVKGPALAAVAPAVKAMLGAQTHVLVAMNGVPWWFFEGLGGELEGQHLDSVDPGGAVAALIPAEQVIGCVVHASCATPEPGLVRHVMGMGLIIGAPSGGRPEAVLQLAELLGRAGFKVSVSERIQRDIWYKLWGNMTTNPMSALTGATCDRILDDDLVRGLMTRIMLEAAEIGARMGCAVDQTPEQRHAITRSLGAFKTSMLQDAEAGRPLEYSALIGAAREIGQKLGMETPFTDALLGLVRLMAQSKGLNPQ